MGTQITIDTLAEPDEFARRTQLAMLPDEVLMAYRQSLSSRTVRAPQWMGLIEDELARRITDAALRPRAARRND